MSRPSVIVADSNTIAYLYLPTKYTKNVEKLLQLEPEWAAPTPWRSELRNILALYMKQKIVDFETANKIQAEAESLIRPNEYNVDSLSVLTLTQYSGCSAYDCEFIALAKALNLKHITEDKKLRKSFPEIAMNTKKYMNSLSQHLSQPHFMRCLPCGKVERHRDHEAITA